MKKFSAGVLQDWRELINVIPSPFFFLSCHEHRNSENKNKVLFTGNLDLDILFFHGLSLLTHIIVIFVPLLCVY